MGLFSHKCPECNSKLEATGYSFPYPTHRCPNCIVRNEEKRKRQRLESRIQRLEKKLSETD